MDDTTTEREYLKRIRASKDALRRELIALPYPEKIRRVIEMQKVTRTLHRDKTKHIYVWTDDNDDR